MCRQTGSCREDDRRPEHGDSAGKTTGRLAPQRGARFRRTITKIYGKYENKALAISDEICIILDFRRFSQNIVLRSPGGYSSEKDC